MLNIMKMKIFKSFGPTKIITSEQYVIEGNDIIFNKKKDLIKSKKNTFVYDKDQNIINLSNFEYLVNKNIFRSVGLINIKDKKQNSYEFSQIYIDTEKKKF